MKRFLLLFVLFSLLPLAVARAQEIDPSPTPTPTPSPTPTLPPPPPPPPPPVYTDISSSYAASEIRNTAVRKDWLRIAGTRFSPTRALTKQFVAQGLVRAFGPYEEPLPRITFSDLSPNSTFARYASTAVKLGWMTAKDRKFTPTATVTKDGLSRAIVRALGLDEARKGIDNIHSADGYKFKHSPWLSYRVLAQEFQLFWNRPNSLTSRELWPWTTVSRADFAYAVANATNAGWRVWSAQRYNDVTLPKTSATGRKVVEYALKHAGFPYIWADEGPNGFDCSGFVWWVLRSGMGNATARGYKGWSIAERSSYSMAAKSPHIGYKGLRLTDIVVWDVEGAYTQKASAVGHAGVWLGNGWMIHSSGSRGGVSLSWMGDGYWRERLVWGRRIVKT